MWDIEDVGVWRFFDGAAVDGPETAEDAEEGRFAAAVGADDEEVVGGLEGEGEGFDEDVAIGGDYWDVDEFDIGAFDGGAAAGEDRGVGNSGVAVGRRGDELLFEFAGLDVIDYGEEGGDTRGVACQFGDFFVREHDAADGIGGGEKHAAVGYEA